MESMDASWTSQHKKNALFFKKLDCLEDDLPRMKMEIMKEIHTIKEFMWKRLGFIALVSSVLGAIIGPLLGELVKYVFKAIAGGTP